MSTAGTDQGVDAEAESVAGAPYRSGTLRYPYLVVGLLTLAYIVSFADRMLLAMMIDPVRKSLGLSDTQISLLIGLAFVIFYSMLSLPLGQAVDKYNRSKLLAGGIFVWSAATAACGLAGGAVQLFLARLGVGSGEAVLAPAAYSLISDLFPAKRVASAMAIFATGITLGSGAAMALSGAIAQWLGTRSHVSLFFLGAMEGWRAAFIVLGLSGIPLALLLRVTIREPKRQGGIRERVPSSREMLRYVWHRRAAFIPLLIGNSALSTINYGVMTWSPAFFLRVHHWQPATLGAVYGLVLGIGGTLGVVAGGLIADALVRRGFADGSLRVVLASIIGQLPLYVLAFLVPDGGACIALFSAAVIVSSLAIGLQNVTIQAMTPNSMRGRMTSLFMMIANLFGLGIGPTLIALFSDRLFPRPDGLGPSLALSVAVCLPIAIALLAWGAKPARELMCRQQGLQR